MKCPALPILSVLVFALAFAPLADAAAASSETPKDQSPAAPLASTVSTVTGIAISPLLGIGAYGAYQWAVAGTEAKKAALPWYAHWTFFVPALLLVAACAGKDTLGTVLPPGFKKPLDVLETIENKVSGLVAAGAVVPLSMSTLSKLVLSGDSAAVDHGINTGGLGMVLFGTADWSWLLSMATVPFGVAMFALVWVGSHAINVLILLSPWGAIDAALKAARTALLGLLTLSAAINPWLGALLSLVVIVVAYLVAGWAFRLTVFGTVFCWDFVSGKKNRFVPAENDNRVFSSSGLPGVPARTYGRLALRPTNELEFCYRPWLVMPERSAKVPVSGGQLAVGRGLFFSTIDVESGNSMFLLPPRYRGHEEALLRVYHFVGVRDAGLRKAWSVLKELLSGKPAVKATAT